MRVLNAQEGHQLEKDMVIFCTIRAYSLPLSHSFRAVNCFPMSLFFFFSASTSPHTQKRKKAGTAQNKILS